MPGTKEGGLKAKLKNLEKDPDFYKNIGRIGGKKVGAGPKGFAADRELARRAGRIGGTISRGGGRKKLTDEVNEVYESGILG